MTYEATARKELARSEADGKETIINEIVHFEFDPGVMEVMDLIFDDWEYAQEHGVYNNDDGITMIDVNMLLDEMDDKIMADDTLDQEDTFNEKLIRDYLLKFKGFHINL